ncbi:hypothetical protein OC834_005524 [Tilletia horrida]|nr:hypothetical protein OC835_007135 [Tilletia horrida]KAK0524482.1 hypothetical protein OC834_005524 [Tilletia horrida]KAK0550198.1 hypothetical protein OC844_006757 [Tilletia horrida]
MLARTFMVHVSPGWHLVRTLLFSIEQTCNYVSTRAPGASPDQPGAVFKAFDPMPGHFGNARSGVPSLNRTTGYGPTFRLRDRPLIAAFLPKIVDLAVYSSEEVLQALDATAMRLWEPSASDQADVEARWAGHTRLPILADNSATTVNKPDEERSLVMSPHALTMPTKRLAWIGDTYKALRLPLPPTPLFTDAIGIGDGSISHALCALGGAKVLDATTRQVKTTARLVAEQPGELTAEQVQKWKGCAVIPNTFRSALAKPQWAFLSKELENQIQASNLAGAQDEKVAVWDFLTPYVNDEAFEALQNITRSDEDPYAALTPVMRMFSGVD